MPHHKASTFVFGQLRCNTRLLMHTKIGGAARTSQGKTSTAHMLSV